jgi:NTE family protein
LQIGANPLVFTEVVHPLNWTLGLSNDWFIAASAHAERRRGTLYDDDGGAELARFVRTSGGVGLDLGQPWGRFGELRAGLLAQRVRTRPTLVAAAYPRDAAQTTVSREVGARVAAVIDQLDFANFPTRGIRVVGELALGEGSNEGRFQRLEASALGIVPWGAHSFSLFGTARGVSTQADGVLGRFQLGGFHQLSGYRDGELLGNYVLLGGLGWTMRLPYVPVVSRAFFVGATAEVGNAWLTRSDLRNAELRTGMSLYVGADTGLGPLYLGLTHAPRGGTGVVMFLGRP